MTVSQGHSHTGALPSLTSDEAGIAGRMKDHVRVLAGEIGERNVLAPRGLNASARYIEGQFEKHGYDVRPQKFNAAGTEVRNIEVIAPGTSRGGGTLVVGAHYDSVPGSPGADDNASAVAALLELARGLASRPVACTVRLVAFVNEEPPFFRTNMMGSAVYAKSLRELGESISGMLCLEMLGCFTDAPGTQRYPIPFSLFYPSRGNFIGFVGNLRSRSLVRACVASFRRHTQFPSEWLAAPGWVTGLGWSDHWAFWNEGYPAIMVTDTAFFRYPYYHSGLDTPEKLNYEASARVVAGLGRVLAELARGQEKTPHA